MSSRHAITLAALALLVSSRPVLAQEPRCTSSAYECAVSYVERHEFASAIRLLEPTVARSSRDLKAINLLGIALTGAGRIDEANARFREALTIDPAFYPARKNLAINEFNRGRMAEAERHFTEVLARAADDEVAHVHVAEIAFAKKDCAIARAHFEKSGERVRQQAAWSLHYAACLLETGETPNAVAVLDLLPSGDATSLFDAGVLLGQAGARTEAARFFGAARSGYKDPYAAGFNQTLMLVEAGDYTGAIRVAEDLIANNLKPAELYNLASRAYVGAGRIQQAYDALREATRLEPTKEHHYVDLALICLDYENFDLGLEIIDVGLHHRPDSGTLHVQRGVLLAMKGLVGEAEQAFDRARQFSTGGSIPHVALAMAWMQSGQTPKAVEVLRKRVVDDSANPVLWHTLGLALVRSGADAEEAGADEAIAAFTKAIALNPDLAQPRAEIGKLLLKRGDTRAAIAHLQRAVALEPENAGAAYTLARAYQKTGDTARARALLARVSTLNAQERGDDPGRDLRRMVMRIVRAGASAPSNGK
jgi:predicted Zn-dependent protease